MKTEEKRACPVCGTLVAGDHEVCPVCALQGALKPHRDSISAGDVSSELRFEHYRVLQNDDGTPIELGRGAMGVTYKALDIHLQCPVALKIINAQLIGDDSARHRFVREARAAARVRDPNLASVFHLGEEGVDYFYAMEFVDGETLEKIILRSGTLKTDLALEIVSRVAAGLAAIHKQHLVHRDIKPSNIMVSLEDGRLETVKIIDLGLAKGVAEEGTISAAGSFIGTPAYASPEQFAGISTDIRSDLYSLGITLWEMLSGKLPFEGSAADLMYQHQHTVPPIEKLKAVPAPVVALLEVLLEKDPSQRFQTPNGLLKALAIVNDAIDSGHRLTKNDLRLKAAGAVLQKGSAVLSPAQRWKRRRILAWLALIPGVAALFIGLFLFFNRAPHDSVALAKKSIAVLPFESLSDNTSDAYFADGVQDEILNKLAKIAALKVISRTSVMQYRPNAKRDLRQIASALGVANVLEGTVRRDGRHVRVTAQLIDARDDKTTWADSYDRDLTSIFAIQSEIAQTIAGKLAATLSPEEKKRIDTRPTDNLEAYDLYLRAREKVVNTKVGSQAGGDIKKPLDEAVSLLDQAVQLDPKFALAYCESARANALAYQLADRSLERRALADKAMNRVLQLPGELPEAHLTYAFYLYWVYKDYQRATVQLAMAMPALPNDAWTLLLAAFMDRRQGHFDKAIREFNEAMARDPLNPVPFSELAETLFIVRRFGQAEQAYDRVLKLLPNDLMLTIQKANMIRMGRGDASALRSAVTELVSSLDNDRTVLCWRLRFSLENHDWQEARELIDKLGIGDDDGNFTWGGLPVPIGCYSILLARLEGEQLGANPAFLRTRAELKEKVERAEADASSLVQLGLVDALLGNKDLAISEAKHAVEMLPISKDALEGPQVALNLGLVYAWTDELDLAFETLDPLTKIPGGLYYGDLKNSSLYEPLRKDPRYDKLLAELAPKD